MLITLFVATLAFAAPTAPQAAAPKAGPAIADPVAPLLQLDQQLRAGTKKNAQLEEFREDLPLSAGKNEAVLDKLPLAPVEE